MSKEWTEEIVYVPTADGLVHAGAKIEPPRGQSKPVAILVLHGIGGSFYYSVYVEMGRELASRGYTVVTGNNRGHHFGWGPDQFANGESRLQGAGWERFSESRYDVAAWANYVAGLGFDRIVLFGHSYGAFKSVYYQGERQDPRIAGIVLCSPPVGVPRLAQPHLIPMIENLVAQGRGRDLLPWDLIPWSGGTMSADAALDVTRTNIDVFGVLGGDTLLSQIRCPILALFGTNEPNVGGPGELELIKRNAVSSPRVDTMLIEGAEHNYLGCEKELATITGDWADTLVAGY